MQRTLRRILFSPDTIVLHIRIFSRLIAAHHLSPLLDPRLQSQIRESVPCRQNSTYGSPQRFKARLEKGLAGITRVTDLLNSMIRESELNCAVWHTVRTLTCISRHKWSIHDLYVDMLLEHKFEIDCAYLMNDSFEKFDVQHFLSRAGLGRQLLSFLKGEAIYAQGDPCDSIYFVQSGSVKLALVSEQGKEATIAILSPGDFVGEECISTVQPFRSATSTALTNCVLLRIKKVEMLRVLHDEPDMSAMFVAYLLVRTSRIQADLVDQLFNSSEKRLARTLLLLAHFGKEGITETLVPQVSQETLAAMIGCTRSRVNFFLNRFRKLGFIEYDDQIRVKASLLQVVLND